MKTSLSFYCKSCGKKWRSSASEIIDEPARPWHPYRYTDICKCGEVADQVQWEINLFKAHSKATGPITEQGKLTTAQNLKGHDTSLTRFNALQHGAYSDCATFFPARIDHYPECKGCNYRDTCENEKACSKKTELFMRHHVAFETRDPSLLRGLRATLQANVSAIIDTIIMTILQDGVTIKKPQWYYDSNGVFHLAEYTNTKGENKIVEDVHAHPLLKVLIDLMARNNMGLVDSGMVEGSNIQNNHTGEELSPVSSNEMREWSKRSEAGVTELKRLINRGSNVIDVTPSNG